MEATYGNRIHPEGGDAKATLKEAAHKVYKDRGKLIIPAFSVGRTQEIVFRLNQLAENGELPPMKVHVDSPLAVNSTDIFRSHPECFDDEMINAILEEADQLHPLQHGLQGTEPFERTVYHHQRIGNVRSWANFAPPEKQHHEKKYDDFVCRLPSPSYARPNPIGPELGRSQNLRPTVSRQRPSLQARGQQRARRPT